MKKTMTTLGIVLALTLTAMWHGKAAAQISQPSVHVALSCGGPESVTGDATLTISLDGASGPENVSLSCNDTDRDTTQTYTLEGPITGWKVDLSVSSGSLQESCSKTGEVIPAEVRCVIPDDTHLVDFSMR